MTRDAPSSTSMHRIQDNLARKSSILKRSEAYMMNEANPYDANSLDYAVPAPSQNPAAAARSSTLSKPTPASQSCLQSRFLVWIGHAGVSQNRAMIPFASANLIASWTFSTCIEFSPLLHVRGPVTELRSVDATGDINEVSAL